MESFDFLEEIRKSNNYDIALLTTFNIEIGFFEHFILNSLNNNGINKVSVYVDGKQLTAALNEVSSCHIGRYYMVNPIHVNGAFHPKLFLLLSPSRAKLFLSSVNLTMSGFCSNNEIVNVFVYDADHPENLKVIKHALDLFERLNLKCDNRESKLFDEIRGLPYYGKTNKNDSLFWIDNYEFSILEQIHKLIPQAESIDIAVPYYDNGLSAIAEIHRLYPNANLQLYLQNGKSRFPSDKIDESLFSIYPFLKVRLSSDTGNEIKQENDRFYHGKVFRFISADKSYILYGSANCTQSALTTSFINSGNLECDVLELGGRNDFDSFFSGFQPDTSSFACDSLTFDLIPATNIWFKYGVALPSQITLCFGFGKQPELNAVSFGEIELPFNISGGTIEVEIPVDQPIVNGVFDIAFATEHGVETVKCWLLFQNELDLYRIQQETDALYSFRRDSTGSKYYQDRIALIQALMLGIELQLDQPIHKQAKKAANEPDPEIDEDDDGIIDYVPPPVNVLKQNNLVKKAKEIATSYRKSYNDWIVAAERNDKQYSPPFKSGKETDSLESLIGDEDKSFVRFVKSIVRKLLDETVINAASPEDYLETILVIYEIIDKYTIFVSPESNKTEDKKDSKTTNGLFTENQLKKMLFTPEEAAGIKTDLLLTLSSMGINEGNRDQIDKLIFLAIVSNHILKNGDENRKIDDCNCKLLKSIIPDDDFREKKYIEYVVTAASMLELMDVETNVYSEITYANSLFGYKTWHDITLAIFSIYGKDTKITLQDGSLLIETSVESFYNYRKMHKGLLRDISNYAKGLGKIKKLTINIYATGVSKSPNSTVKITYSASQLPTNSIKKEELLRNGKVEKE